MGIGFLLYTAADSMNYLTIAIGAIIGGEIATLFSFQVLFLVMALLCFGSGFYILHLKRGVL